MELLKCGLSKNTVTHHPIIPVSYTHLDVYKRQLIYLMERQAIELVQVQRMFTLQNNKLKMI